MVSSALHPSSQLITAGEKESSENKPPRAWGEWFWSNGPADWPLLLVSVAGIGFGLRTLNAMKQQTKTMEDQVALASTPRVYVLDLKVANFEAGKEPVFFLRIANAGPVPAENVWVFLEVEHAHGRTTPKQSNAVLIPAQGNWDYFFRASFVLPTSLDQLEQWDLKVRGTVRFQKEQIPVCYKYHHWAGERPDGVPIFITCDFDHRRNVAVKVEAATMVIGSAGASFRATATPAAEEAPPEENQRQGGRASSERDD